MTRNTNARSGDESHRFASTGGAQPRPALFPRFRCAPSPQHGGAPLTDKTPKRPHQSPDRWPHGWWIVPGSTIGFFLWLALLGQIARWLA